MIKIYFTSVLSAYIFSRWCQSFVIPVSMDVVGDRLWLPFCHVNMWIFIHENLLTNGFSICCRVMFKTFFLSDGQRWITARKIFAQISIGSKSKKSLVKRAPVRSKKNHQQIPLHMRADNMMSLNQPFPPYVRYLFIHVCSNCLSGTSVIVAKSVKYFRGTC